LPLLFQSTGKAVILIGLILIVIGVLMVLGPRLPFLEKIPGNIRWQKGPVTVFFPLGLSIIISIVLTILLNIIGRK
jgi:hypothetical protein